MDDNRGKIKEFCRNYRYNTYTLWLFAGSQLFCKVGYSSDFESRRIDLAVGFPKPPCFYCLLASSSEREARRREKMFHDALDPLRVRGEWFSAKNARFLIGAWAGVYGLITCIAGETEELLKPLSLHSDWGYYNRHDNPMGDLIYYSLRKYVKPLANESWERTMEKVREDYGIGLQEAQP